MRNKIALVSAFCALATFGVADIAPARADHRYDRIGGVVAGGIRVGGLDFEFVHAWDDDRPAGSFVRVAGAFGRSAPPCGRFCFRDGGHRYHDRSCPALRTHSTQYRPGLLVLMDSDDFVYGHAGRYDRVGHYDDRYPRYVDSHRRGSYRDDERYDDRASRRGYKHGQKHGQKHGHKHGHGCGH